MDDWPPFLIPRRHRRLPLRDRKPTRLPLPMGGSRPVSGKNLQAGPAFTKDSAGVWQSNRTNVTLRNTVTDADGDAANLSFQVYTTDASGNPKTQIQLTNPDTGKPAAYGMVVADFVASGGTANVTIRYEDLKPNTTYAFRTSAYDGALYETQWSSWAKFHTRGRAVDIKLPEPNKNAPAVNQDDFQEPQKIPQPTMTSVPPAQPPTGLSPQSDWDCGDINPKTGIQPCSRIVPGVSKSARQPLAERARSGLPHLVDWCEKYSSHIKRYGACIAGFTYEYKGVVVKDGKPTGEILNASWAVGQEIKLSGNSGTFTQQLILVPVEVDPKFVSVTLDVQFDCLTADKCSNGPQTWDGALEWTGADPISHNAIGKINHTWTPADSDDLLDLSTTITAYSPVANASATRWQSGSAQIRCDTIASTTPGCAFYKYIPTWVMNFAKTPPAVAHAWLIQSKLPNHPGSKTAKRPMFFLPAEDKNAPPAATLTTTAR
ncbi:fibronectin type III domain-containing protein [Streptomyces sp. NRRL F-5755]|uniref:fibronectin type III domain-containing protein n=1 Tax=Streptomyces sp. NRRL F-5755 TaxID=1519475 RepID=UPI0013318A55|nr:fibronectin type III domain-containing protein [Streptomyces sp. NRRL F-5755]